MSNFIEFHDKIAFHPGYNIKETIENIGLTQEDFAKRLNTTPKNLSELIRGKQSLSIDIAMKLSRMLGTSVNYWLNLQSSYDTLIAQMKSEIELEKERKVFQCLDYKYFRDHFGLPHLPRQIDQQIKCVREFLNVSSLTVFTKKDMSVSFRSVNNEINDANTIKANIMVQIAINKALKIEAPKFNKRKFMEAIDYASTLTQNHDDFFPLIHKAFLETGVIFIILPNLSGSKTNGATKKIGDHILLMVNDRRLNADTFWFTLFHEVGHIINSDFGISFDKETGEKEVQADQYARDILIPRAQYQEFVEQNKFNIDDIKAFANLIHRDPGIVLGRLQNDGFVRYDDWSLNPLRRKYKVKMNNEYI